MPDTYLRFLVGSADHKRKTSADAIESDASPKPMSIPILSFDLGPQAQEAADTNGGRDPASQAADPQSLTVVVSPHVLTSPLADSLKDRKKLESLAVIVEKQAEEGSPVVRDQYVFSKAAVTSIGWSEPNADTQLSEIITFSYGSVKVSNPPELGS
jgi:hypothetical protein